mgnify:CR=1 FL=1
MPSCLYGSRGLAVASGRGGLVDTVRSFSLVFGETSFGMMRTKWGRRLVASGPMRSLYGVSKAVAFCLLALALGLPAAWALARHPNSLLNRLLDPLLMLPLGTSAVTLGSPAACNVRTIFKYIHPAGIRSCQQNVFRMAYGGRERKLRTSRKG